MSRPRSGRAGARRRAAQPRAHPLRDRAPDRPRRHRLHVDGRRRGRGRRRQGHALPPLRRPLVAAARADLRARAGVPGRADPRRAAAGPGRAAGRAPARLRRRGRCGSSTATRSTSRPASCWAAASATAIPSTPSTAPTSRYLLRQACGETAQPRVHGRRAAGPARGPAVPLPARGRARCRSTRSAPAGTRCATRCWPPPLRPAAPTQSPCRPAPRTQRPPP